MSELRTFLEIPYDELEERNLDAKKKQLDRVSTGDLEHFYLKYLEKESPSKRSLFASATLKEDSTCWITTRNFFLAATTI
jgi:hypothetical protein